MTRWTPQREADDAPGFWAPRPPDDPLRPPKPRNKGFPTPNWKYSLLPAVALIVAVGGGVVGAQSGPGSPTGGRAASVLQRPARATPIAAVSTDGRDDGPLVFRNVAVEPGQTAEEIARDAGRSLETVLWANSVPEPDAPLPEGVNLAIPPVDGITHIVQPGDTLQRIADAYAVTVDQITGYAPNRLRQDADLHAGARILIANASLRQRDRVLTYTVRPDDTIRVIAARFGLKTTTILWANEVPAPDLIHPGQELTILPTDGVYATIQAGDTINHLAEQYGVEAVDIVDYAPNQIDNPDQIIVGQRLIIPGAKVSEPAPEPEPEPRASAADNAGDNGGASADTGQASRAQGDAPPQPEQAATPAPTPEAASTPEPAPAPTEAPTPPPAPEPTPTPTQAPEPPPPPPAAVAPASQFIWPVKGTITQNFGPTSFGLEPPYKGYAHFHNGLDIANSAGTSIVAAAGGTVAFAGWNSYGLGYAVKIDHGNGYSTWYGHMLRKPSVGVGQHVDQGQQIGLMGSTGNSTGPHLHFIVAQGDDYEDPLSLLP